MIFNGSKCIRFSGIVRKKLISKAINKTWPLQTINMYLLVNDYNFEVDRAKHIVIK